MHGCYPFPLTRGAAFLYQNPIILMFCANARLLPSFESQKMVTEKTTKGEKQAYSPLETPQMCAARTTRTAAQTALLQPKLCAEHQLTKMPECQTTQLSNAFLFYYIKF